ncbi:hypothetical protein ABZ214_00045 [Streptomyces iakyrus]
MLPVALTGVFFTDVTVVAAACAVVWVVVVRVVVVHVAVSVDGGIRPVGPRPCRSRAVLRLARTAQRFGRGAAPRAGKGAVEVPSARVAVVHVAGRLSSAQVTFLDPAVKVL